MITYFQSCLLNILAVGGGTSGAVFAARLSEEASIKNILLLEAGDNPTNEQNIDTPILADANRGTSFDWQYQTVPQKDACKGHVDGVSYNCDRLILNIHLF